MYTDKTKQNNIVYINELHTDNNNKTKKTQQTKKALLDIFVLHIIFNDVLNSWTIKR